MSLQPSGWMVFHYYYVAYYYDLLRDDSDCVSCTIFPFSLPRSLFQFQPTKWLEGRRLVPFPCDPWNEAKSMESDSLLVTPCPLEFRQCVHASVSLVFGHPMGNAVPMSPIDSRLNAPSFFERDYGLKKGLCDSWKYHSSLTLWPFKWEYRCVITTVECNTRIIAVKTWVDS